MNKTQFLDRCREIFTAGRLQEKIMWQLNEKYGITIDYKLQEIVDKKITMDFSWFQKKEIKESGLTYAQEYLLSLGILEWGQIDIDVEEWELNYNEKKYSIITNPLAELDGYPGSSRFVGKIPRIKAQPFLLVPIELANKIKVLKYLP